jgi:glycine dehydrogenase
MQDQGNIPFSDRHIGSSPKSAGEMLKTIGFSDLDALVARTVPSGIRQASPLDLGPGLSEAEAMTKARTVAGKNKVLISMIGQGYYDTLTPAVIQRNILENSAWYTAYTPYQPEISQGRLEALLNFQTMVADLTGLPIANASLLDEATAVAEAMAMARRISQKDSNVFFVDDDCHPQTISVVRTRAEPLGWKVVVGRVDADLDPKSVLGAVVQ